MTDEQDRGKWMLDKVSELGLSETDLPLIGRPKETCGNKMIEHHFQTFDELWNAISQYMRESQEVVKIEKYDPIDISECNIDFTALDSMSSTLFDDAKTKYYWGFKSGDEIAWIIPLEALKEAPENIRQAAKTQAGINKLILTFHMAAPGEIID